MTFDNRQVTDQLRGNQLICLGSDGANMNKTGIWIWNCIDNHMIVMGLSGLLPFIYVPCNLQVIHNAFREGLNEFGNEVEHLVINLYIFKASRCRKKDVLATLIIANIIY